MTKSTRIVLLILIFGISAVAIVLIRVFVYDENARNSQIWVIAKIDWNSVTQYHGEFPSIETSGPLFKSSGRRTPLKQPKLYDYQVADFKTINNKKYFGVQVSKGTYERPSASVFSFYTHRNDTDANTLEVYLNTSLKCEVQIENFSGGQVWDTKISQVVKPPYVFNKGTYYLLIKEESL